MLFTFAGCSSGADSGSSPSVSVINTASTNLSDSGSNAENSTSHGISSTGQGNNIAGSSQSPLVPVTSETAIDMPLIRPDRPFPDFPPNYLQFLPQWLYDDFKDGYFIVGGDGIAANYQVWHEFTGKLGKGKDTALTIQTFEIDKSIEDILDKSRYHMLSRYHLSVMGDQAVWKCLSEDKDDVKGKLSFTYDNKTGVHEVFIERKKIFEFIYFPYDPKQSALYFGYTPLEKLPSEYSKEHAIKDGCLIIEQGVIQNPDVLTDYNSYYDSNYLGRFIRIFFKDDEGIKIMDIGSCNERTYITVDYSRHSNRDGMEDMYVTTYYDNSWVGVSMDQDTCSLDLGREFFDTIFIFENLPMASHCSKFGF